jgi:hypothetical protein
MKSLNEEPLSNLRGIFQGKSPPALPLIPVASQGILAFSHNLGGIPSVLSAWVAFCTSTRAPPTKRLSPGLIIAHNPNLFRPILDPLTTDYISKYDKHHHLSRKRGTAF